jgi:hypothetical protein
MKQAEGLETCLAGVDAYEQSPQAYLQLIASIRAYDEQQTNHYKQRYQALATEIEEKTIEDDTFKEKEELSFRIKHKWPIDKAYANHQTMMVTLYNTLFPQKQPPFVTDIIKSNWSMYWIEKNEEITLFMYDLKKTMDELELPFEIEPYPFSIP